MADEASAERFLAVRTRLALSQGKLAKRLGIRPQTISAWERGEAYPRMETAQALAGLAGVSVEWLLSGRQNGPGGSNVIDYIGQGRKVSASPRGDARRPRGQKNLPQASKYG